MWPRADTAASAPGESFQAEASNATAKREATVAGPARGDPDWHRGGGSIMAAFWGVGRVMFGLVPTPVGGARAFFEATVADNIDIGRPDEVKVIFERQVRSNTKGEFATKLVTRGTDVTINAFYKHSRIKEYLKEGCALRIETVVNSPTDLGCLRRLVNLPELQAKARAANRRMLEVQRAGQGCAIESALFERISQPSLQEGQRTGALRFGHPRVMALTGALCVSLVASLGFTNKSLRALVASLLGAAYGPAQMTYDLRRLRLKGLVVRVAHTNTYTLTPEGLKLAIFYTKLHRRLLHPLLAADQPPAPTNLRAALGTIDRAITDYIAHAKLALAT
ncbi:MAG: hypothetical protein ACRDY2_13050 [Acidimicrobiales bacterium]